MRRGARRSTFSKRQGPLTGSTPRTAQRKGRGAKRGANHQEARMAIMAIMAPGAGSAIEGARVCGAPRPTRDIAVRARRFSRASEARFRPGSVLLPLRISRHAMGALCRLRLCFAVAALLLVCCGCYTHAVQFEVSARTTKCIAEEIQSHVVVVGDYKVVYTDEGLKVTVKVCFGASTAIAL